jgi:uncharacterized protein YijF (DUF1287 family)
LTEIISKRRATNKPIAKRCLKIVTFALSLTCAFAVGADSDSQARFLAAAVAQTQSVVRYDGSYRRIPYPGGDVPANIGVCTDVVIRAYRAIGIDLQRLVHEDMRSAFTQYPSLWGATRPDSNIDHRRVPNLQTFLQRRGAALTVGSDVGRYRAGDLVTWMLPGNLPHIGIVLDRRSTDGARPMIVHNIGRGPEIEDMLFSFKVTGHYRFNPVLSLNDGNGTHTLGERP